MVNTTVIFDGKQIQLNLPDYPTLDLINKALQTNLGKTFDARRHVVQLFDSTIGEYFDLNDNGLKSWLCLPIKEKSQMRLQIIRAEVETDPVADVFQKIQNDIQRLFQAIESTSSRLERRKSGEFLLLSSLSLFSAANDGQWNSR